jgi:hypothetical protein
LDLQYAIHEIFVDLLYFDELAFPFFKEGASIWQRPNSEVFPAILQDKL